MDVAKVMQAVADRMASLLPRSYGYPELNPSPPASVVSYPESITFDETYDRDMDTMVLPVLVILGRVHERTTAALAGEYAAGSGPKSVKQHLETGTYTDFEVVRVSDVEFDAIDMGGVPYLAAIFTCEISGKG